MKKIDFDLESNSFTNFLSARHSMTARVNVEKTYKYSKDNGYSFFIISLGCILKAANKVPEFKRRIINNEVIEFDYLDGLSPIMDDKKEIFREMRVEPPMGFKSVEKWHEYVKNLENEILSLKNPGFIYEMDQIDNENIINCSCIPWVDFDSFTNCVFNGQQIMPLLTWGKMNDDYEMPVSTTVSHIFVYGLEFGYFYKYLQQSFDNPQEMIQE